MNATKHNLGVSKALVTVLALILIIAGLLFIYGEWQRLFKVEGQNRQK